MLGLVTSLKMMVVVSVLLQIVLPNLYSATQGTLVVKGQSCYVSVSCHLLGYKELVLLFSTSVDFSIPVPLSGTVVSAMEWVLVCFRQHFFNK